MVGLLTVVIVYGLVVLRSAVDGNEELYTAQIQRYAVAYVVLIMAAQIPPHFYLRISPLVYVVGMLLLVLVLTVSVKGSQRWLEIPGLFRFQPSELMKLAVPMAVAWYLQKRSLPPSLKYTAACPVIMTLPALLIGRQPDFGTSILVFVAGFSVLLLAGLPWRLVLWAGLTISAAAPLIWQFVLEGYQRQRVLTLFDPQSDPLGAGWNIIQSTTAIGSGGIFGKGLFQGSQSYLDFTRGTNRLYEGRDGRRARLCWRGIPVANVPAHYRARAVAGLPGRKHIRASTRGCLRADILRIRFRQRGNGQWHFASGRGAPALGQLWWDLGHYAHGGIWCHYVGTHSQGLVDICKLFG